MKLWWHGIFFGKESVLVEMGTSGRRGEGLVGFVLGYLRSLLYFVVLRGSGLCPKVIEPKRSSAHFQAFSEKFN